MFKNKTLIPAALLAAAMTVTAAFPTAVMAEEEKILNAGATTGFFGAESLDVAYNWDGWIMSIYGISENLFRLDENYVPQPYLAEAYEQVDENTWVFTLRDGVTFTSGNPMTAEAVKGCLERTYSMNERASSTLAIDSIEADGQTLTIVTASPDPTMLNDLCDPLLGIYDPAVEPDPELGVACTGPYAATQFTAMESVNMVKNENYWQGDPKLDAVNLTIVDDMNTLTMSLQNGEIDLIARLDPSVTDLFEADENFTVDSATSSRASFVRFNLENAGIDDLPVRLAIGYVIDRESFADVVYNGFAEPMYGVYSTAVPFGGTEGLDLTVDSYDPEKAAEILAEAGYEDTNDDGTLDKDGTELNFKLITYSYNPETLQLADMLQSELSNLGVGVSIETFDILDESLANGDFDLTCESYAMAPIGTPQYFANMVFKSTGTDNYGHYVNETVDEMTANMSATFDMDEQYELARQICQQILNDRPLDFVGSNKLIFAYNNVVSGVKVNPSEYYLITWDMDVER